MRFFAEYFDTRRMFTETEIQELTAASLTEATAKMPLYASYFRLFNLPDEVETPAGSPGVEFRPVYRRSNETGYFFPDSELYSLAQISNLAEVNPYDYGILSSNMRANRWTWVVKHRHGGFQPFDPSVDRMM